MKTSSFLKLFFIFLSIVIQSKIYPMNFTKKITHTHTHKLQFPIFWTKNNFLITLKNYTHTLHNIKKSEKILFPGAKKITSIINKVDEKNYTLLASYFSTLPNKLAYKELDIDELKKVIDMTALESFKKINENTQEKNNLYTKENNGDFYLGKRILNYWNHEKYILLLGLLEQYPSLLEKIDTQRRNNELVE